MLKKLKYRIQEVGIKKTLLCFIGAFLLIIYILGIMLQYLSADVLTGKVPVKYNPVVVFYNMFSNIATLGFLLLGVAILVLFLTLFRVSENRFGSKEKDELDRYHKADDKTFGSAGFMDMEELEATFDWTPLDKAVGPLLGKYKGRYISVPLDRGFEQKMPNDNILAIGVPGAGKTVTFITPNIYQAIDRGESIVTTDVKGDVYRQTFGYAMHKGYTIKVFNIDSCDTSDGWNILKSVGISKAKARQLAKCILTNTLDPGSKSPEAYFENGMENLLTALILYVNKEAIDQYELHGNVNQASENPYDGYGTIGRLYDILLGTICDKNRISIVQDNRRNSSSEPTTYQKIKSLFDAIKPNVGERVIHPAYQAWQVFEATQEKNRDNFVASLATRMALMQEREAREILGRDDIDLVLPGTEKCIYYVNKPAMDTTHAMMTASFFTMMFTQLINLASHTPSGSLPRKVSFICDEFANIGKIPDFEKLPATVRSQGIKLIISIQTLTQLQRMYPDMEWENIKAMCAINVLLSAGDDETTTKAFSTSSGVTTVQTDQMRVDRGTFKIAEVIGSYSQNLGSQQRAVLTQDEIRRMDKSKTLVVPADHNVIILDKFIYKEMKQSKYEIDVNINNHKENVERYMAGEFSNAGGVKQAKPKYVFDEYGFSKTFDQAENDFLFSDGMSFSDADFDTLSSNNFATSPIRPMPKVEAHIESNNDPEPEFNYPEPEKEEKEDDNPWLSDDEGNDALTNDAFSFTSNDFL